jgi:hypothetical protein
MYNEWSDDSGNSSENVDFGAALRRFDRKFERVQVPQRTYDEVPDGRYDVCVEDVELGQSRNGNPMLKWTLRITGPNQINRRLFKRRAITDNTLAYLKEELSACGVSLDRISDLPDQLSRLRGLELPVVKVSRNGDSNIYFRSGKRNYAPASPGTDDDTPF